MTILGVTLAALGAYVVALLALDSLRIDTCLDRGGAWDREAEACLYKGMSIRSAYPTWAYGLTGTASIVVLLTACTSVGAVFMRRWDLARRLGGRSFAAGIAILIATFALATIAATSGGHGPESRATRLAKTLAELMNSTATVYPALAIGAATWATATVRRWRRRQRADSREARP